MKIKYSFLVVTMLVMCGTLQAFPRKDKQLKPVPVVTSKLSRNDRLRFEYFYIEAARQQSAGHYDAAFDLLQHALSINPQASEAYFELASYYSAMKNDSLGLVCLEKAARLNPESDTYLERLGEYYIGTQKYTKAIQTYENLWSHNHTDTDALDVLSQLYHQQKDYKKMLDVIRRLELEEGTSERLTLAKMRVYDQMDDKKQAYLELKSLVIHHPNDVNYKTMLGNWLMQNNRAKEAYNLFIDVLKDEPNNNLAQTSLYDYYTATHQDTLAQVYLNRLLRSNNTPSETKNLLLRAFIQKNEQDGGDSTKVLALMDSILAYPQKDATIAQLKAAYMSIKKMPEDQVTEAFKKVLEIAPDDASARINVIQNLWNKKDYDGVIAMCKPAREYNPDELAFYYFDGLAHYQKKDDNAALEDFRRGVSQINSQSNSDMVSDVYAIMGDILNAKERYKEAFAAYDSCLQWKPDNVPCLNNYAYYLSLQNLNLKKAEEMSYKTVKAEPKNSTYLDTYAYILFLDKRYSEARIYIDQAMTNMDSVSTSYVIPEHAGDIYALSGDLNKAEMYWKQSLKMGNKSKSLQRKIKLRKYIKDIDEKKHIH